MTKLERINMIGSILFDFINKGSTDCLQMATAIEGALLSAGIIHKRQEEMKTLEQIIFDATKHKWQKATCWISPWMLREIAKAIKENYILTPKSAGIIPQEKEPKTNCKDRGIPTKKGVGSARCPECWDSRFGEESEPMKESSESFNNENLIKESEEVLCRHWVDACVHCKEKMQTIEAKCKRLEERWRKLEDWLCKEHDQSKPINNWYWAVIQEMKALEREE